MDIAAPPSINDARTAAFDRIATRMQALDLSPILVYRFDSVPSPALPYLAWQFDVLNAEWQLMIGGGADYRTLIKTAIPLHRYLGTPYAIKTALAALGWTGVTILEGQNSWGGVTWPSNEGWAVFRVYIDYTPASYSGAEVDFDSLAPAGSDFDTMGGSDFDSTGGAGGSGSGALTAAAIAAAIAAITFFKPARSWLDSLWFNFPGVSDTLLPAPHDASGANDLLLPAPSDTFAVTFAGVSDTYSFVPQYNRRYQYAGITYAKQPVGPTDGAATFNGSPVEGNP